MERQLNGRSLDSIVDVTVGPTVGPTVGRTPANVKINVSLRPWLCVNQKRRYKLIGGLNIGYKFHDE